MEKSEGRVIERVIKRNIYGVKTAVGFMVAAKVDGKIKYGWSLAKVKPSFMGLTADMIPVYSGADEFSLETAKRIAYARLESVKPLVMPQTVVSELKDRFGYEKVNGKIVKKDGKKVVKVLRGFQTRAQKYFKLG